MRASNAPKSEVDHTMGGSQLLKALSRGKEAPVLITTLEIRYYVGPTPQKYVREDLMADRSTRAVQ